MTRLSIIFFIAFILISCLEEDRIPTEYSWNQTFDLAAYLEANGNYINENYDHSIISPDELYDNLDSYLIIDIRSAVEYADAHIKNSINLNAGEIVSYLDEHYDNSSAKTVIVCSDGHNSAFTVSLLRLLGYNQIYSLDYGLGYWNKKFSNVWLQNIDDSPIKGIYTTNSYPKSQLYSDLPIGLLEDDPIDIRDKLFAAVDYLLKSNFYENMISMPEFEEIYNYKEQSYNFSYIICYGDTYLYEELVGQTMGIPPSDFGGHPRTAVHYNPIAEKEFMLSTNLLTLPPDQEIFIYSYNGQRSAYLLAFLRLLGYNAKIIKFGALGMLSFAFRDISYVYNPKTNEIIDTIFTPNNATSFGFWEENIRNYEFVGGN